MTAPRLWTQVVPAFVIVGALWVTGSFRPVQSGVDVRVERTVPPRPLEVSVAQPGRRETLGTRRADPGGRVRFDLEPGRYVVLARARDGSARRRMVVVRDDRYVRIRLDHPGAS